MSLENMVAAMSCLLSMCGDNTTPALMKNSVITQPLDDFWGEGCRTQALDFNKKLTQLQQSQQKATDTLSSIEKSLKSLSAISVQNLDAKRSKREVTNNFDALAQPRFSCNGSITGLQTNQNTTDLPTFLVDCENKSYGNDWRLIAALNASHRNSLSSKSKYDLVNGFGDLVNRDNVSEYFIGLRRLRSAMILSNGRHELLILTHGGQVNGMGMIRKFNKQFTNNNSNFAIEEESKGQELTTHEAYEGDIIDLLESSLGVPFSIEKSYIGATDRLSILVKSKSNNVQNI